MKTYKILPLLLLAAVCWSCKGYRGEYSEKEAWDRISRFSLHGEVDSLTEAIDYYLDKYPEELHAKQVEELQNRLERELKDWRGVDKNPSIDKVNAYLHTHPDGMFREKALAYDDSLHYVAAHEENTPESYREYMLNYPTGRFVEAAAKDLEAVEAHDIEMEEEEREQVTDMVMAHFAALQSNSEDILTTVHTPLHIYMGKHDCTDDDVLNYMEHMHSDMKEKVLNLQDLNVRKLSTAGVTEYNATFNLVEVIEPNDSALRQVKNFPLLCVLNENREITSIQRQR